MINVKKEVFLKKLFLFFYAFLGSKRIKQMRLGGSKGTGYCVKGGGSEKGAHAFEGARDCSGNELPTGGRRRAKRQLCLGKGAGGCELQRKARCPAGARARKIDLSITAEFVMVKAGVYE